MQQILDSDARWNSIVVCAMRFYGVTFDRAKRRRLARLQSKLAISSHHLPPSLWVDVVDPSDYYYTTGAFADIYRGTCKGVPVALKQIRIPGDGRNISSEAYRRRAVENFRVHNIPESHSIEK